MSQNPQQQIGTKIGTASEDEVAVEESATAKKIAKGRTALKRSPPAVVKIPEGSKLSTGCSLLNAACSGNVEWALHAGQYVFFVGDSGSGKTMLVLQLFAEACRNAFYNGHKLVYDNPENGALMDMARFFGSKAAARIEGPPRGTSQTIEEFYFNLDTAVAEPCIYILDSMDSLSVKAEEAKFAKAKAAKPGSKPVKGSMGMGKAKANSERLRPIVHKLLESNSILVIISQTRDRTDAVGFQPKKTRSGGHALEFYAHLEIWTSTFKNLAEKIGDVNVQKGILCRAKVKKNRVNGFKREVTIPIYPAVGIDEVGSLLNYLIDFGFWKKSDGRIKTDFLDDDGNKLVLPEDELIAYIENNDIEGVLRARVQKAWDEIERRVKVERKPRYE